MKTILTTEERIWAVFAHLSALAFGMGILIPVIGWSEQRRKSKYASFQCLQALGYQSLGYTVWLLAYLLIFIAILIVIVMMSYRAERNGLAFDPSTGAATILVLVPTFVFLGLYMLFPILAAITCASGKVYHYPVLGNRLADYLNDPQANDDSAWFIEEHEDRWVVATGHFSVIIVLWGILAPLTVWSLQGKRSGFLRFQSIQTVVYQAGATLLFFGAVFIYSLSLIMFPIAVWSGTSPSTHSSVGMIGLVFLISLMFIGAVIILIVPLFHILGQWAGYRLLKGENYRYPLLGRLVEKRIANNKLEPPSAAVGELKEQTL